MQCLKLIFIIIIRCVHPYVLTMHNVPYDFLVSDDDNRVVLKPIDGIDDCQHDYINASFVNVSYILN